MIERFSEPLVYAVKHKDFSTRMASRSGGIFTALSDEILAHGGVIYGCVLTSDFTAIHTRAETAEERNKMRGSKYVASDLGTTFHQVKQDLESGRQVLFSGLPCQVAGLRVFLSKDYENLLCVDLVCHGTPSPKVWQHYLNWQTQKYGTCVAVDFRDKKNFGWKGHIETLTFSSGKVIHSRIFTKIFYGHAALRPSCYVCPYKSTTRVGDISIADYWGIEKVCPNFNDNKGVSLVFLVNEKGKSIFESVTDQLDLYQTSPEMSFIQTKPYPTPAFRETFWQDFAEKPFQKIAKKYGQDKLSLRGKRFLKRIYHKIKK